MKSFLLDLVFSFITRIFKRDLKKQGLLIYLKALNGVRLTSFSLALFFVFLNMIVFSFFAALFVGVWLLPLDFETKLFCLLGVFSLLFTGSVLFVLWAFSEKTWLVKSGADHIIRNFEGE